MDWFSNVFVLIGTGSFSNIWYWIILAVYWSVVSHWVLGVPYDMVQRAGRHGGQAQTDLEDMVRINTNRLFYFGRSAGTTLLAVACFILTGLGVLGFYYWIQFAQAAFALLVPMVFLAVMSFSTARRIVVNGDSGEALRKRISRHRIATQILGMIAILVISMFGMYQNLNMNGLLY